MKQTKWLLALALLGLATTGWAQSVVQDGQSSRQVQQSLLGGHMVRSDSTQDANTGDGSGNQYTKESSPDQTFLIKRTSVIQNSLFRVGSFQSAPTVGTQALPQVDSCTAQVTLGATRMALAITYTLDTDSLCGALLCVEVRGGYTTNTDSLSTFKWNWSNSFSGKAVGAAARDTLGSMATTATGTTVAAFASIVLDTTNVSQTEKAVWLNEVGPFRHIWLPITNRDTGEWFSAPYTSVRVRIIKNYGSTACTAWTGKAAPRTSVNIDLVGWR